MNLTLAQVSKVILTFSRNLQDPMIPPQIQTMCVKLLMGLSDNLMVQSSRIESRQLLVQILYTFTLRLTSLRDTFPTILKYHNRKASASTDENFSELPEIESFIDIGAVQPVRTCAKPLDGSAELVKGTSQLMRHALPI